MENEADIYHGPMRPWIRNPTRPAKVPTGRRKDPLREITSVKKLKLNDDLMVFYKVLESIPFQDH